MLRPYLIIDGYNLMHECGLARRTYAKGQLQRCRSQLVRFLAQHLTGRERERTTIVFDAGEAPPGLPRQSSADGMTVCFASPGKEADDTIEELIAAHSAPRQIRLVSSDHRLQRSARRRRGAFVDSDKFAAELERRGPVSEAGSDADSGSGAVSDAPPVRRAPESASRDKVTADASLDADPETENWLRIFGDITEADDLPSENGRSGTSITQADVAAIQEEINRQDAAGVEPRAKRPPRKKGERHRK